jgi:aromatic ring-opening dioxygenase LigB subunit
VPLVLAAIAPHGWLLVPLMAGPDAERTRASRAALEGLGRRLEAAGAETIVVVEPHGLLVEGTIALLDTPRVAGGTRGPEHQGATAHGFSLGLEVDRALNAAIVEAARAGGAPAARVRNFLEFLPLTIEYGALVPLLFLAAHLRPAPRVVVASMPEGPEVPRAQCVAFGRAVRAAAEATGRRVALVASADLAHTHAADGPFGFDPAAAECDRAVVEAVREGALERVVAIEPSRVIAARSELKPVYALHGALDGTGFRSELLAYEVPTYFGMLTAAFAP